ATARKSTSGLRMLHPWRGQYPRRGVGDRNDPISIYHPVLAHRVAAVARHQAGRRHRSRKGDLPRDPVFAAISRIGHTAILDHPSHVRARELNLRLAVRLSGGSIPLLTAIVGVEELAVERSQYSVILRGEPQAALLPVLSRQNHRGLPGCPAIAGLGQNVAAPALDLAAQSVAHV